jgi:type IV pilus assembly protein PilV
MSRQNNNLGFTLVELLMAMLITMVGLLGLLKAVEVAIEHNLRSQLRNEAVFVGEQWMANLKVRAYGNISTSFSPRQVPSQLRGGNIAYTVTRSSTDMGSSAKVLTVGVTWNYKGVPYSYTVSTIRSQ